MNFVNKANLEAWGREAAEQFLTHQVPLNESIEKIAQDNQLNPEQIKRVCEFANINEVKKTISTRVILLYVFIVY